MKNLSVQRLHLWCGLIAGLWLAVLGGSGFMLDHREHWRWMWQAGVSPGHIPEAILKKSQAGAVRLYQLAPQDHAIELAGGMTGMWWRDANDVNWQETHFTHATGSPLVYQILFDESLTGRVWLASDDGLWLSIDNGRQAIPFALGKQSVTAIARVDENVLYAVVDRSFIYKMDIYSKNITVLKLSPPDLASLPDTISLSRFVRDLHYGRGVTTIEASLLWNDITGIALVVMPLTGILFYWLPKRWRRRKAEGDAINHGYKKQLMRWLFRLHGPTLGLLTFIPILYLAITGILLDHSVGLRQWMKETSVSRGFQTPVYTLSSWQGHIYGVTADAKTGGLSLATRLGLFTTHNQGQSWQREKLWGDKAVFVWILRQQQSNQFVGGMGSPNFIKYDDTSGWHEVKGHAHMPSDITLQGSNVLLKNRKGLWQVNTSLKAVKYALQFPSINYIPWFYVIDGVHSGLLIHAQWKWFNDLIAVMAMILVITGLMRWWKTKWI